MQEKDFHALLANIMGVISSRINGTLSKSYSIEITEFVSTILTNPNDGLKQKPVVLVCAGLGTFFKKVTGFINPKELLSLEHPDDVEENGQQILKQLKLSVLN